MTESDHITLVDSRYICGGALAELEWVSPAARIIDPGDWRVTTSETYWSQGLHYRTHLAAGTREHGESPWPNY